jgi:hypothetical protein
MSDVEDLGPARRTLRHLAKIVKSTRQTLAVIVREAYQPGLSGRSGTDRPVHLFDTLEHLGEVREGFILSQRTPAQISLVELRALIQHVLLDWGWLQALDLALAPGEQIENPSQQLLVYNHALVALGILPHLPAEAVTFPQTRPSYADVNVPVLPNEMLARIEEIERIIYQAEVMPGYKLAYDPFRRTYAFFEASHWLVNNYLKPLL